MRLRSMFFLFNTLAKKRIILDKKQVVNYLIYTQNVCSNMALKLMETQTDMFYIWLLFLIYFRRLLWLGK